ncbi:hypothetical protein LTR78_002396 [Recurvomyces mirabilis]|uniref:Uncharacterized protein n=1 Tax=Recurvomyces mirabilis TaxID=574656 RepID=A0AAE0WTL5_9PEZI|nr:hypothetical protein LTR78_002396 [Recurvomyces mirabilis]KAK5157325.1 hypothetical protein LTS14_004090 [Recurvomyces mirabilis]
MSNFEQSPFDPKQCDEQETYYIQKARRASKTRANTPPSVPPKDRKYTQGGLTAHPPASHNRNQSAAYPALPTSNRTASSQAPTRKAVGSTLRPKLDLSNATYDQQGATVQSPLSSGERTKQTIPLTHRDRDGKYHEKAYDNRPLLQSPIEQAFIPAVTSSPTPPAPARPSSSTSRWSFGARKDHADTDSIDSSLPQRPRSRAGSLTDKVFSGIATRARRASQSMKEKADIVRMDSSQRDEFCARYAKPLSESSDDWELERQEDPRSRPFEQKRALLEKNRHLRDVVADTGSAMVDADYENMVATTEANRKINEAYATDYERRKAEALLKGENVPNLPRRMPTAELALSPSQRSSARVSAGIYKEEVKTSKPELTTSDKVAVRLGKTFDKLYLQHRERSNTLESEMSFADIAVPAGMEKCSYCGEPPKGVLRDGLCTRCRTQKKIDTHQAAKSAMKEPSIDRFVGAQNVLQQADPDSPPWMRVAAQRKMRRVRRTVYAGVPSFAADDDRDSVEFTLLPFKSVVVDTTFAGLRPGQQPDSPEVTCLLNGQPFDDASESPADGRVPFGSHPDDLLPLPPTPGLQSTPTLMKADRHTSQRAIAELQEASPRSSWQAHPRSLIPGSPTTSRVRERDVRNTQFYGFYNDIFSDYQGKRDSLSGARR